MLCDREIKVLDSNGIRGFGEVDDIEDVPSILECGECTVFPAVQDGVGKQSKRPRRLGKVLCDCRLQDRRRLSRLRTVYERILELVAPVGRVHESSVRDPAGIARGNIEPFTSDLCTFGDHDPTVVDGNVGNVDQGSLKWHIGEIPFLPTNLVAGGIEPRGSVEVSMFNDDSHTARVRINDAERIDDTFRCIDGVVLTNRDQQVSFRGVHRKVGISPVGIDYQQ